MSGRFQKTPGSVKKFTLIELLVVISIIAILAALLLPSLNQARAKAREIACLSNGKQLGIQLVVYVDSQKEFLPPRYDSPGASINDPVDMWYGPGKLNVPTKLLLGCGEGKPNPASTVMRGYMHYGMADFSALGDPRRSPRLSFVITPQNIVAFSDSSHPNDYNVWIYSADAGSRAPSSMRPWIVSNPGSGDFTRFRHGNKNEMISFTTPSSKLTTPKKSQSRASFAFIDGHAQLMSPYEAYQPAADSDWTGWNTGKPKLYWKHWINKMPAE
ncbi:MAG: hypothetical protein BWY31_01761 [Lentisphaerae bacterium ADurb.Bin242]|nr:MAG: hypothetical protein BWY31_01761 [Lentisphaerae bacterium ADurb.Bin242]